MTRSWFRFENSADASIVDIHIIDFIGDWIDEAYREWFGDSLAGVTAKQFVKDLGALPEAVRTIRVHINSPGGDVQGGVNIANALREQGASRGRVVETYIDGIAASIASVIAMAGTKVFIADNALVMTHNPWSVAVGNAADMRRTADILDTVRKQIVNTYKWHSSLSDEQLSALMDGPDGQGTWMDASEAIANGFATDKIEGIRAAASIDPRAAAKLTVPEKFRDRVKAFVKPQAETPVPADAVEVLRVCTEGGCLEVAAALLTEKATPEQVQARVALEKKTRADAKVRADAITAVCAKAKVPELAEGYIAGGMTVEAVKAHMTTLAAKLDAAEIDGGLNPDRGGADVAAGWKTAHAKVGRRFGAARSN